MKSRWMCGLAVAAALAGCGRPPASEAAKATGAANATASAETESNAVRPKAKAEAASTGRAPTETASSKPDAAPSNKKSGAGPEDAMRGADKTKTAAVAGAAVVLTPEALKAQEFELADRYAGKTLEVTGVVRSVERTLDGRSSISLATGEGTLDFVMLPVDEKEAWARVAPGQRVTLRAAVADGDPSQAVEWDVTDAGTNPAPVVTPESLAAEFGGNGRLAFDRYQHQPVYLKGKVGEVSKNDYNLVFVSLDSPDGLDVQLTIGGDFEGIERRLKKGDPLAALAFATAYRSSPKLVTFDAQPLERAVPAEGVRHAAEVPPLAARTKAAVEAMRSARADLRVTPSEMLADAEGDRDAYDRKYRGKVIEVTGRVVGMGPVYDAPTFALRLQTDDPERPVVFALVEPTPWAKYGMGQTVTVRGRATGFLAKDPTLERGVVVAAEDPPEPRPAFTAEELARQAAENPEAFEKERNATVVEVTGTIDTPPTAEDGTIVFRSGDYAVQAQLESPEFGERAGVLDAKAGTPIRLFGVITYSAPNDFILVDSAWILPAEAP